MSLAEEEQRRLLRLNSTAEQLQLQAKEERQAANVLLRDVRATVIEECARVADGFGDKYYFMSAVDIAAAIRALKEKP